MIDHARMLALAAGWTRQGNDADLSADGAEYPAGAALLSGRAEALRSCARDLERIIVPLNLAAQTAHVEGRRIVWVPGTAGGNLLGMVGDLPSWAFQIFQPGDPEGGWKLMAQMPGLQGVTARRPDLGELQGLAEQWLAAFVGKIGATFAQPALAAVGEG